MRRVAGKWGPILFGAWGFGLIAVQSAWVVALAAKLAFALPHEADGAARASGSMLRA